MDLRPAPIWEFQASDAVDALRMRSEFVAHLRRSAAQPADIAAAETIYAELVANVIRHAPGPIWLAVDWTRDRKARLRVRDTGQGFRAAFSLPDGLAENGRGLFIVAALAEEIRVDCAGDGCVVTVVLPVEAA